MNILTDLFLTSTGRIGRAGFALSAGALLCAWAVVDQGFVPPAWLQNLAALVLTYSGFCVLSQRLHDRGRSGWWSAPIILLFAQVWPRPQAPLDWIAAAALVPVAFDLLILPGQKAFNRYGAPPTAQPQTGGAPD